MQSFSYQRPSVLLIFSFFLVGYGCCCCISDSSSLLMAPFPMPVCLSLHLRLYLQFLTFATVSFFLNWKRFTKQKSCAPVVLGLQAKEGSLERSQILGKKTIECPWSLHTNTEEGGNPFCLLVGYPSRSFKSSFTANECEMCYPGAWLRLQKCAASHRTFVVLK